jgi:hypothetical protein
MIQRRADTIGRGLDALTSRPVISEASAGAAKGSEANAATTAIRLAVATVLGSLFMGISAGSSIRFSQGAVPPGRLGE